MAIKSIITVDGTANVRDVLSALGIAEVPADCTFRADEDVTIAVQVDADEAREELDEEVCLEDAVDALGIVDGIEAALDGDRDIALVLLRSAFTDTPNLQRRIEDLFCARRSAGADQPTLPLAA